MKHWLRGFGFCRETCVRGADGQWRFSGRKLERTLAETALDATALAYDATGENARKGR